MAGVREWIGANWHWLLSAVVILINAITSAAIVLYKRDSRAAVAWIAFLWVAPILGCMLFLMFGVNRIQRRAQTLRRRRRHRSGLRSRARSGETVSVIPNTNSEHMQTLVDLVTSVSTQHLTDGNNIEPLVDGEQAFPAMLAAIDSARRTISLSTYIFDNDAAGRQFIDVLGRAVARGVDARVLVDDLGAHYSWPTVVGTLQQRGVRAVRFLRKLVPWRLPYANLCNHRKILVADGIVGFTGGMNIRAGHHRGMPSKHRVQDVHFRIVGPVVAQLQDVFADDWHFSTGEQIVGDAWFPEMSRSGQIVSRGITSGPDDDLEKLRLVFLGAVACAKESVRIVTPYFLPDQSLVSAINIAALRGVQVDILLPLKNNLRLVQWASMAQVWQVLGYGCRVWQTAPPFDHSKLFVVDGAWSFVGSANWDARSLRLNFEFGLECYDRNLAACLNAMIDAKLQSARPLTMHEVNRRNLAVKLRDGVARLFSPYL
jgi:cardiolipin synthase